MFIVDDPMLALIARFRVDIDNFDVSYKQFLNQQIQTMKQYVEQYPENQQQKKALEWIEKHARNYRQEWQKRILSERVERQKCPDCPLVGDTRSTTCEIHDQWFRLLQRYVEKKITSRKYVEDSLKLMDDQKARLKVTTLGRANYKLLVVD